MSAGRQAREQRGELPAQLQNTLAKEQLSAIECDALRRGVRCSAP